MSKRAMGKSISLRVNPRDCLSVLDIAEAVGIPTTSASFSALVSLAFSSLIETARKNGIIPDRDGFEYSEMMTPFEDRSHKRKLMFSDAMVGIGSRMHAPAAPGRMSVADLRNEPVRELPLYNPEGDIPFMRYNSNPSTWTPSEIKVELRRQSISLTKQGYKEPAENVVFDPSANPWKSPQPAQSEPSSASASATPPRVTIPGQREAYQDLQLLIAKKKGSLANSDIYWGTSDEVELQRLKKLIFSEDSE